MTVFYDANGLPQGPLVDFDAAYISAATTLTTKDGGMIVLDHQRTKRQTRRKPYRFMIRQEGLDKLLAAYKVGRLEELVGLRSAMYVSPGNLFYAACGPPPRIKSGDTTRPIAYATN